MNGRSRFRNTLVLASVLALSAMATPAARAQDAAGAGEKPEILEISTGKDGYTVLQLLEAVNHQTGRTVLYNSDIEKKLTTLKVQFMGTYRVPRERLFDWLQGVLSFSAYILIPIGPTGFEQWMVVDINNQNIRSRPTWVPEEELEAWKDRDGVYIVSTLRARNLDQNDAARARAAIQQLVTTTASIGRINEVPGQNAFVMADFAPVVYAAKKLLSAMDVPIDGSSQVLDRVTIEHALASDIEGMLNDLLTGVTGQQGRPQPQNPRMQTKPDPQIIADNRTNSLVLYAVPDDIEKIKSLIVELDVPFTGKSKLNFRTLRYQEAVYVSELLDELIQGASSSGTSSSRTTNRSTRTSRNTQPQQPGGQPFGTGGASENDPVIIPDEKSNSLIIHATEEQYAELTDLIDKIDSPRKQVLIETALVELTVGDTLDFGIEGISVDRNVAVDTNGDGIIDTFTDAQSFFGISNFGGNTVITQDVNGVEIPVGTSPNITQGLTAGIFNNGKVPLILKALQTRSPAKIVTMPSIVTSDNQSATITTEDTVPFLITTFVGPNQTPQQTFDSISATTRLTISPTISADDYLRLSIDQEVSSFRSAPAGQRPPTTSRRLETALMVPNASTVVLGGIVSSQETESTQGIPVLMDIPLLGVLFRSTTSTLNKTNLFLFITPRIMKDLAQFRDFHAITWEKKLLQDRLFGEEVKILGGRFLGPQGSASAIDAVERIEDSGVLDAYRYKAPAGEAERVDQARRAWEEMQREKRETDATPAGDPPAEVVPVDSGGGR